jgi:hypothetical protein
MWQKTAAASPATLAYRLTAYCQPIKSMVQTPCWSMGHSTVSARKSTLW